MYASSKRIRLLSVAAAFAHTFQVEANEEALHNGNPARTDEAVMQLAAALGQLFTDATAVAHV